MSSTTIRSTVRTIERGVRCGPKSQSQNNLTITARSSSGHRSSSPAIDHVKQQLCAFIDHSQLEKNELSKLNDRMSSYVNRVKCLECENQKLMCNISDVQSHWGEGTRKIKEQYEQSLFDLRGRIDDVANCKTVAEVRNKRAQYELGEFQKRVEDTARVIDNDKSKIKNLEREICALRENKELLNKSLKEQLADLDKYRLNRDETWSNLVDLLDKLDDELFRRISVEYNNQTLREHIEFLKQIHEKELAEMSQLAEALPFNDQIEFYKDQLKRVIANIRADYEALNAEQQRELEEWMRVKQEELQEKAKQRDPMHDLELSMQMETIEGLRDTYDCNLKELDELKRQHDCLNKRLAHVEEHIESERVCIAETMAKQGEEVRKLNDNIDQLLEDYNHINTSKASLEYELNVYKRLLDSQLERFNCNERERECVKRTTTITSCQPVQQQQQQQPQADPCAGLNQTTVSSNAFGGKVQNKKEKKGAIGIADCSPDGKFIILENLYSINLSSHNNHNNNQTNSPAAAQQSTTSQNPNNSSSSSNTNILNNSSNNNNNNPNISSTPVDLSGWVIRRKVDANQELIYRVPNGILLPANREVTIWASGSYKLASALKSTSAVDLVADFENWGIGINSVTRLINQGGEEKSSFYQHISFSNQY